KKHKLDFTTAAYVFADESRLEFFDEAHSTNEDRYITIGAINGVAVVVVMVVYTERNEKTRLISASKATPRERSLYYENL
ncbi:BrnT family toxin, partial [Eubacterium aggregans]|uniref:BrnT family toxin n=1 Tax=Eubacterium aggregans TaxID=81409 RepID=UPI003F363267